MKVFGIQRDDADTHTGLTASVGATSAAPTPSVAKNICGGGVNSIADEQCTSSKVTHLTNVTNERLVPPKAQNSKRTMNTEMELLPLSLSSNQEKAKHQDESFNQGEQTENDWQPITRISGPE